MRSRIIRLVCAIACVSIAIPAFAQYGHPLKGSWSGEWWLVKGKENRLLLDFNFTSTGFGSTTLTGILNPGPDQVPMQNLTLTPPDVVAAGKAAIAARDSIQAKLAADAAATVPATPPATTVTAAAAQPLNLAMGSAGDTVTALQKKLGELGFATGETNGKFGKGTHDAVMAFQKSKNLAVDGVVGPLTGAALGLTGSTSATPAPPPSAAARGVSAALKDNVALATEPWLLHFEADAKDESGKMVHYVVDGKMENLGAAYTRVITGTWKVGSKVGFFKVVRN